MTKHKITLHISSLDDMGRRFVDAWHRAEAGERLERDHFTIVGVQDASQSSRATSRRFSER